VTLATGLRLAIRPALFAGPVVAALISAGFAAAETKTYSYRVELAETAKKKQVHAGGVVWECRARYCIAAARGGNVSVRGCRELASQVGRVVSYRSEIKRLEGEQIDACNTVLAAGGNAKSSATTPVSATGPAKQAESPARVTTQPLMFTGVHNWSPAR
jgi:hypothetical protein